MLAESVVVEVPYTEAQTVWHSECPLFRTAPVHMYLLSARARESGCKFVLSGEGADELFCGYPIFRQKFWIENHPEFPSIFASHVARWRQTSQILNVFAPDYQTKQLRLDALHELTEALAVDYCQERDVKGSGAKLVIQASADGGMIVP